MKLFLAIISLSIIAFSQIRIEPELIELNKFIVGEAQEIKVVIYNDSDIDIELIENNIIGRDDVLTPISVPPVKAKSSSELVFEIQLIDNIHFSNAFCFNIYDPLNNTELGSDCIQFEIDGRMGILDDNGNEYYTDTYNKFGFDLFIELEDLVMDHKFYTYRDARTFMWEDFNNVNGEVECVYTGRKIQHSTGIPNVNETRFNTEHTWPQSKGSDYEPPKSDLHHIFPTYEQANSTRASFPYGYVDNPTWEEGGSKLGIVNGETVFEVRDIHKGNTARAIYYFALRYGNVDNYINSQEEVLYQWNFFDLPDEFEKTRNDKIYNVQENRNPFVDNPYFIKRIGNYASQGSYPIEGYLELSNDKIIIDNSTIQFDTSFDIFIANIGYKDIEIIDILIPDYLTLSDMPNVASWQQISKITITPNFEQKNYQDDGRIQIVTKDSVYVVDLDVDIVTSVNNYNFISLFPNPVSTFLTVDYDAENLVLVNMIGNEFEAENQNGFVDLNNFQSGVYLLKWNQNKKIYYSKIFKN